MLEAVIFRTLIFQGRHSMLKYLVAGGLTSTSGAYEHHTETNIKGFEQLDGLQNKHIVSLEGEVVNCVFNLG